MLIRMERLVIANISDKVLIEWEEFMNYMLLENQTLSSMK